MISNQGAKRIADQLIAYAEGEPFETISLDRDVAMICKRLKEAGVSLRQKVEIKYLKEQLAVSNYSIQKAYQRDCEAAAKGEAK